MTEHTVATAPEDTSFALDQRPSPSDPAALCRWLQHRYVRNERDDALTAALSQILERRDGCLHPVPILFGTVQEARGLVVTAESGAGKSALLKRNLARIAGPPRADGLPSGVLSITVTHDATLKSLAHQMCMLTGFKPLPKATGWSSFDFARRRCKLLDIGVLLLDEAHHLLMPRRGGVPASEARRAFKMLLQGTGGVALVLAGVPSLETLVREDQETSRRMDYFRLSPITGEDGRQLLIASIQAYCRWSDLELVADPFLSARVLHANHANLGSCLEMTLAAIRGALAAKRRALTLDDFALVFDRRAHPDDINPFAVADWERNGRHLSPPRRET